MTAFAFVFVFLLGAFMGPMGRYAVSLPLSAIFSLGVMGHFVLTSTILLRLDDSMLNSMESDPFRSLPRFCTALCRTFGRSASIMASYWAGGVLSEWFVAGGFSAICTGLEWPLVTFSCLLVEIGYKSLCDLEQRSEQRKQT